MRIAVFSTKPYDEQFLTQANANHGFELCFLEPRLNAETARLAAGCQAVCAFVNDQLQADVIEQLVAGGTRFLALRCAGFNHVDLVAAQRHALRVVRVPAYSPHAVAEHTVALMLALNRKIHRAWARVREGNFALQGLLGFDLFGRTVGVVGTGQIGTVVAQILRGFGCRLVGYDPYPNETCRQLGMEYLPLDDLFQRSDIITLNCPLTPETRHVINERSIALMRRGVMIVNTSRGAVVDTPAVIEGLKSGQIGYLALDVYEEEADYFFEDLSDAAIADDVLARLLTFPNVLITGHQAFFTAEALSEIARVSLQNLSDLATLGTCVNEVPTAPRK
jgi:D-lactate dehydrogenase